MAAYCRVSTDEEEQLTSYEAQRKYYTDKIMSNPEWNMAGIFADEGITGTSTKKREEFNRMIRKCRQKKIDLILTKSISRFARNTVDCLNHIRALKSLGIGVYFEKENINTLSMDTELILTFMGAFAQSESESICANVKWGIRQAMKEGKVHIDFNRLYGYKQNEDGVPEIDESQAAAVQLIFDRYLLGDSLREIVSALETKGTPSPRGKEQWDISAVRSVLTNEKYAGDVLMQKTFKADVMSGKVIKNTGQLPMYLVENNHPAIVSRERFKAVQTEMARRRAAESPSKKNSSTGRTCYASKFALSERLVCGECGTLYRRCTWSRKGQKRIVWRCVSRLDYGTQYCHDSPTMEEERLQQAILAALNSVMSPKKTLILRIADAMTEEVVKAPDATMTLGEIRRRLEELEADFEVLFNQAGAAEQHAPRFQEIANEMRSLKEQREKISAQLRNNEAGQEQVHKTTLMLNQADHHLTEWNEDIIRQLIRTVKVIAADRIKVILYDDREIEWEVGK